jgi:AbrB family looped-hinge helix DNA binding protein
MVRNSLPYKECDMPASKLTSKGQITIPKEVRDQLGLRPGDEVEFVPEDGSYRVRKRVTESPFDLYVGYLENLEGRQPDELIEELRGE